MQGGSQALSRALFARLIPENKSSEFFGFYAVAERFATVLGPLVFMVSVTLTGSSRMAVLFIIVFFAAGRGDAVARRRGRRDAARSG